MHFAVLLLLAPVDEAAVRGLEEIMHFNLSCLTCRPLLLSLALYNTEVTALRQIVNDVMKVMLGMGQNASGNQLL